MRRRRTPEFMGSKISTAKATVRNVLSVPRTDAGTGIFGGL